MKTIVIASIATILTSTAMCQVAEIKAVPPADTAAQKVRNPWFKSKGFLSEDQSTFRSGAKETLVELGKEIDAVSNKVGDASPVYFQTRIQSLKQQQLHLAAKLNELDDEKIKSRQTGPRYAFDRCVGSLEEALDQVGQEAQILVKVNEPEKRELR